MLGELTLGQSGVYKSFVTSNQLVPPHKIILDLVEGPFDVLEGQWSFSMLGSQGCKVSLALRFEFNSVLLEKAFSAIFTKMSNSLVEAFCKRAKEIYGERSLF
jgi:ribosome-associated toxin RatA of RatAB toxin-antitoxin module